MSSVCASTWEAVQQFLFREADLIDHWRLEEWCALYAADGRYLIPPLNSIDPASQESAKTLFLLADDKTMLEARVKRMLKKTAFVENPRSHVRHMITNVRIVSDDGARLAASANFCVYRIRRGVIGTYIGEYQHRLLRHGPSFLIEEKRVCLDLDQLDPQGSIGIIL